MWAGCELKWWTVVREGGILAAPRPVPPHRSHQPYCTSKRIDSLVHRFPWVKKWGVQALILLTIVSKDQAAPAQKVYMPAVRLRSVQKYTESQTSWESGWFRTEWWKVLIIENSLIFLFLIWKKNRIPTIHIIRENLFFDCQELRKICWMNM